MRWTRKIGVVVGLALLTSRTPVSSNATYTIEGELIKLTASAYAVTFSANHGGIVSLTNPVTQQHVSDGSVDGDLWSAKLDNTHSVNSSSEQFSYAWADGKLTLSYSGDLDVQVTVSTGNQALKLQASVTNHTGANVANFDLPAQLKTAAADVHDALLPMMPGALLSSAFFTKGQSFVGEYPGIMFADYLALRSARGQLAVYTQRGVQVQPAVIGFLHVDDQTAALSHSYQTWIANGTNWQSPAVIVTVGQDYPATINHYRTDNQIDQYPSLRDKLGNAAPTHFAAPMYKLDFAALKVKFADVATSIIDKLNFPGIFHLVVFQPRGFDKNYPDFLPPDPKWGTQNDFTAMVRAIHQANSLAIPYTNFSWWDNNGPTLKHLPAGTKITDSIVIKDSHGIPDFKTYGPNSGFVMNLHNAFVEDKIAQQHTALLKDVGVDAIFEDQWGARPAPYDFNPSGLDTHDPATSYFEGVRDHYQAQADSKLMTEVGVDVLADHGIAFMGTNYLWDMLGYRSATANTTSYYPMAGMLLRDKVLLYQHDLAAETWTSNEDVLRWNLVQGYSLSNAFYDPKLPGLNMDNPWLNLIGVFQHYALANYTDQRVQSFDDLGNGMKRTTFATYTVYSNWNESQPYSIGGNTLPPGGVVTQANDGSVTAGIFTAYDGQPLSRGDHYLVEVRKPDVIQVFQPIGADTPLMIQTNPDWTTAIVTAYHYDGTPIAAVDSTLVNGQITFTYASRLKGETAGSYRLTPNH